MLISHPQVQPVMKRACDNCIARKLRCDGGHPCTRCRGVSGRSAMCTFLKPAAKRGPKFSAVKSRENHNVKSPRTKPVPSTILNHYITIYAEHLYQVWPVLDSGCLSKRLSNVEPPDIEAYILAAALSAATASQLQLPIFGSEHDIDATYLAAEVNRCRSIYEYREKSSYDAVLTSFFLHIYYATLLKPRSSMTFLQEAVSDMTEEYSLIRVIHELRHCF